MSSGERPGVNRSWASSLVRRSCHREAFCLVTQSSQGELRELLVRGGEPLPEARRALLVLVIHQGHHGLQRLDLLAMPCNGLFFVFHWRPTGGHRLPLVWGKHV